MNETNHRMAGFLQTMEACSATPVRNGGSHVHGTTRFVNSSTTLRSQVPDQLSLCEYAYKERLTEHQTLVPPCTLHPSSTTTPQTSNHFVLV